MDTLLLLPKAGELESYPSLGNGYYLMGNDSFSMAIVKENESKKEVYDILILGQILKYNYDKKYIIVYRNASTKARVFFFNNPKWEEQSGKDSLQYWIIEKNKRQIFGPLNKQDYKWKRDSLKMSKNINLESAYYTP